ncbi:MAG: 4-alpha-glucanotransferase [Chitinivibrionales bacterium]|nr:4-alpha-glucanotransferase [Chitinivibrionales bacterium]
MVSGDWQVKRQSGIFAHFTSLPSPFGIGDFGVSAYRFIDALVKADQKIWHVCTLNPTGFGDSPYQCLSSFAINPLFISPLKLYEAGLLTRGEIRNPPVFCETKVAYGKVIGAKHRLYRKAFERFAPDEDFEAFCRREQAWLDDYALYCTIKDLHNNTSWSCWPDELKHRFPGALDKIRIGEERRRAYHAFVQYCAFRQYEAVRAYAGQSGVGLAGDLPHFVAYDSADCWSQPELFELDESGTPLAVAGVPPDYYSADGQRWGNPLYRWDWMREQGFAWWRRRLAKALSDFDYVRLNHFRGFDSYWSIRYRTGDAQEGSWRPGPGLEFFKSIDPASELSRLIADDGGEFVEGTRRLVSRLGIPGIAVLQFAFEAQGESPYLPYNLLPRSVLYTATHDNNTSLGWFEEQSPASRTKICNYLGCTENGFIEAFIRNAYSSPAGIVIVPLQDVLGLGAKHRLNTPGKSQGNWRWRFTFDMLRANRMMMLKKFARWYGR